MLWKLSSTPSAWHPLLHLEITWPAMTCPSPQRFSLNAIYCHTIYGSTASSSGSRKKNTSFSCTSFSFSPFSFYTCKRVLLVLSEGTWTWCTLKDDVDDDANSMLSSNQCFSFLPPRAYLLFLIMAVLFFSKNVIVYISDLLLTTLNGTHSFFYNKGIDG